MRLSTSSHGTLIQPSCGMCKICKSPCVGIVGDLSSETFKMLKTSLVWLGARASSSRRRDYADIAYFHTVTFSA